MKAEADRAAVGAGRPTMLQGNQLKLQRGAAAKTEGEDRNNGEENRPHAVTVRLARENLQPSQPCGDLSKDRASAVWPLWGRPPLGC
jgi:hypothetical protein